MPKSQDVGCVKVHEQQRTTVEGLYATGDLCRTYLIVVATGQTAIVAYNIYKSLPPLLRAGSPAAGTGAVGRLEHEGLRA